MPSEVLLGETFWDEVFFPSGARGNVSVYIDGNFVDIFAVDGYIEENIVDIELEFDGVSLGEHNIIFVYSGDGYYKPTSANFTFTVSNMIFPDVTAGYFTDENPNVYALLISYVEGPFEVLVDGKQIPVEMVDDEYRITLNNITSGIHNYTIRSLANESFTKSGQFNATYIMWWSDNYGIYGQEYEFEIMLPQDATGIVTVNIGGKNYTSDVTGGKAAFKIPELNVAGEYDMNVTYSGDEKYYAQTVEYGFDVYYEAVISVNGTIVTVSLVLPEDATGKLNIEIDHEYFADASLVNGRASYVISDLEVGTYEIRASYSDYDYSVFSDYETVTIAPESKMDPNITVTVSDIDMGGEALIEISMNELANDQIIVNVGGRNYTVSVDSGVASKSLYGLKPGTYNVTVYYEGNDFILAGEKTASFTVRQVLVDPSLTITASDINIGEDAVLGITIDPLATGKVTVNVNDKNYTVTVTDGVGNITVSGLAIGSYTAKAMFEGDDTFLSSEKTVTFTVKKGKIDPGLAVSVSNINVGEDAVISVSINSEITSGVTVNVGGKDYDVELTDGQGTVTLPNLAADTYTVKATFKGNENFTASVKTATFTVSKRASVVSIDVGSSYSVGDSFEIGITNSSAVNVTINGVAYDVADGKVVVDTTVLAAGEYTVVASIAESDMYLGNSTSAVFTISKRVSEVSISVGSSYFAGDSFEIGITNSSAVNVTINGVAYDVADGKVVIDTAALSAKEYTVVASIAESDMHTANSTSAVFTISKRNAPITITVGTQYYIGDSFEIAISNATPVTVMVNGEAKEVSQGRVVINTTALAANTYTVTASCEETDKYLANSTTATFKIIKYDAGLIVSAKNITAGESEVISIAINENATGFVVSSFDNVTSPVNISQGKGNVTLEGLTAGTYTVKVVFMGDSKFDSAEQTVSFIVSDAPVVYPAKIVAKDLSAYYNKVSYSVTVYGTDGNVAAGVEVIFKVNGKKVGSAKTNAKGVATIKLKQVPKTYKITSEALGKTVTKKLTVKQVLKLKKVKVKKSAKKLVLTATLKEGKKAIKGKKITFKFNGKKFKAKTNKKGVAKVTVKEKVLKKLKVGKKVKYQATYLKDTVKKSVKVKK